MAKITLDLSISGVYYNETLVNGIYYNGVLVWSYNTAEYNITFDPGEGYLHAYDGSVQYSPITITTVNRKLPYYPSKAYLDSHTFLGWFNEQGEIVNIHSYTVFTENIVLYAHYTNIDNEYPTNLPSYEYDEPWDDAQGIEWAGNAGLQVDESKRYFIIDGISWDGDPDWPYQEAVVGMTWRDWVESKGGVSIGNLWYGEEADISVAFESDPNSPSGESLSIIVNGEWQRSIQVAPDEEIGWFVY